MDFTGERYIPGTIADSWLTGKEHWQRYLYAAQFVKDKDVLDIASGEGYGSNYLAKTARQVYGVDISREAVEHASNCYIKDNITFIEGSVDNIPIDNQSVDVVVSYETLEHVDAPTQTRFLDEVKRILRPEGILIISCPNKAIATDRAFRLWNYVNEFHLKELYIDEFEDFLKSKFENVAITHQRTEFAQVINNSDTEFLDIVLSEKKDYSDTQNMIAVCSNVPIGMKMRGSIVLDTDLFYLQRDQQLSDLIHSNEQLLSQVNENYTQLTFIQQQASTLREELQRVQNQIQLLERENERQNAINYELESEKLHLIENIEGMAQHIQELDTQIRMILISRSWRITAPLRRLMDLIKNKLK